MACVAIIDMYINNKIKRNSLTITEKYHFEDEIAARSFANTLKNIDPRIINYKIEVSNVL